MMRVSATHVEQRKPGLLPDATGTALEPRQVAVRVRREHATIRALLDDVDRACIAARERRPGGLKQLLRAVWELYVSFEEHLVMEEAQVVPIIRAHEAFGDMRADEMLAEHDEQRRVLLALVDDTECDTKDTDALVARVAELVASFRSDITAEDAWLAVL